MILGLLLASASSWASTPITLHVGGRTIAVEVADTPQERALGLMGRASMGPDDGMLFVYPDEAQRSFWMKNTILPLSIAFVSRAGSIVHLADMEPLSERPIPSMHPTMFAIEMNRGWFEANGVKVGQRVGGLPEPAAR